MLNNINFNITLPNPVPCSIEKRCKGMLVPIFRPTEIISSLNNQPQVKEGINEVVWKCSECNKIINTK